ncbi:MAG: hypothetical protein IJH75_08750 [Mogibacterium sp.]|nr:hypothetical protein [Mogibacterium sp.]
MTEWKEELKALAQQAVKDRRYLHANAELSFEETGTAAFLREKLAACGVEFEEGYSGNSVVCCLTGAEDGPTIAFRADIDALPILEDNDLP